jgi:hypothetical protein
MLVDSSAVKGVNTLVFIIEFLLPGFQFQLGCLQGDLVRFNGSAFRRQI